MLLDWFMEVIMTAACSHSFKTYMHEGLRFETGGVKDWLPPQRPGNVLPYELQERIRLRTTALCSSYGSITNSTGH